MADGNAPDNCNVPDTHVIVYKFINDYHYYHFNKTYSKSSESTQRFDC